MPNTLNARATLPQTLVAHSGKQHAYRHALSLQSLGCLAGFVTSSYFKPRQFPDRLLAISPRMNRFLLRRSLAGLREDLVHRRWRYEAPEIASRWLRGNSRSADIHMFRRDERFDRWVARRFSSVGKVFWGFQGSCLHSLAAARAAGRLAVAEFTIAHVTTAIQILSREIERHPEWAATVSNAVFPDWYRERLEQEPFAADYCIVTSGFMKRSLLAAGVPEEKMRVLPLGVDLGQFQPVSRRADGPFRILFVGGVGQRKGVKYLLEAYRKIRSPSTELVLAGPLPADMSPLKPYEQMVTLTGRLNQAEVIEQMRNADVMVLPSLLEGFALVVPEAMATGLPVIASTHTGSGTEMIREGRDGFVIEPDDVEGLARHLDWLATHRQQARQMGNEASERAHEFSWSAHAGRVAQLLHEIAPVSTPSQ